MKRLWPWIYLALFAAAFLGGLSIFGKTQGHTNVDWVFVAVSFLGLLVFPPLAVGYARSRTTARLPAASFSRGFRGGWWVDPLQCLRVTSLLLSGMFLGSLFTLPHATSQGVMIVWWHAAMAFGSTAGELVALKTFRGSVA
jgi:hypothetical protein